MTDVEKFQQWLEGNKAVIPVIALDDLAHAVPMAQALAAGGIKVLEVTLRTAAGLEAIARIKRALPDVVVGAGTVCTEQQFDQAVAAGAEFIVSPGLTENLLRAWKENVASWQGVFLPGVATASEVMYAREQGLTFLKCFPASAIGGIPLLKGWSGPFPDVVFCPTGGLNPTNYQDYLALKNVACIGGSWLTDKTLIQTENWAEIERLAREVL